LSMTVGPRRQARALGGIVVIVLAILMAPATEPAAAAGCPDRGHPDADYLCPFGPTYLIPALTDLGDWDRRPHYQNLLYGDLDGDGADEMVARGQAGTEVYRFRPGTGQWSQVDIDPVLPDRAGWDKPQYYRTVQLGDVDGDGRDELAARSPKGVIVFRYVRDKSPGDAYMWKQLTEAGPFNDADGWGSDPRFYATIKLSPIGRQGSEPAMQLIGRAGNGLLVHRWTGSGWTRLASLPDLSDANGWGKPEYYSKIMAWDRQLLLARGSTGVVVYRYTANTNSWERLSVDGPCPDERAQLRGPCDVDTIQFARGVQGTSPDQPVVLARQTSGGLALARFKPDARAWDYYGVGSSARSPWHEATYAAPEYRRTIQAADIDGDGRDEVIGRIASGVVAFEMRSGQPPFRDAIAVGKPALADKPWAKPQYYETIATARLDPDSRARWLLARGPNGVRTWRFDDKTWKRPKPYGSFPQVDADALAAMTRFLGIARGTVRDAYTDPTRDPTDPRLQNYQASLSALCTGLASASPPRWKSCSPPGDVANVSAQSWTEATNQIVAELYWARQVVDHFATLDDIQTKLVLDTNAQFPSLERDLKLRAAQGTVAKVDNLLIYRGVLGILSALPNVGEAVSAVSSALEIAVAATPQSVAGQPAPLDGTFADIQRDMARRQQEVRDAIAAHRRYVLSDYHLLATVGRLVGSETWRLNRQAALSAGRQSFTRMIYQAFLPKLWDLWSVTRCHHQLKPRCNAPEGGRLMNVFPDDPGVRFEGLVPRQTPCTLFGALPPVMQCSWRSLEDKGYEDTVRTLVAPVSRECTYNPAADTSWRYGCTLGVRKSELFDVPSPPSPWAFRRYACEIGAPAGPRTCPGVQPN
jgi:FG-GAP-like repeat